ncbi:DUF1553 domain-containing protein [Algoriphagus zhangzhouensis]|uniref:Planctomycete cytochrome C n=1 Tax=Algoriphagus zhangzhouensis TaxID=1073327 RepID=A0A1M7Z6Q4_9BACT|nr:DUF1553 domain-containing protein [Algoriphagus zhangzhouensis]TDY49169.1 cytochrome c [Algoriphagus zhangzhouensis]SHO60534.1 Planctomycete cytochrome C [Algoriphagus zhangzhouensis]
MTKLNLYIIITALVILGIITAYFFAPSKKVDFSTEIKPILNKHCISCHGGVKKSGGFSVLFEEEALAVTESGHPSIIPGDANNSELIKRLSDPDPELRMPYGKPALAKEEIQILKDWINEGANWGKHWAYETVQKPEEIDQVLSAGIGTSNSESSSNPIDFFVAEKLEEQGLTFSPQEDPNKLLRRVSLDITGLPPTDSLLNLYQGGKINYEQAVDYLLNQPSYGENWASWWLDLARYADTKGYERDVSRTVWPYRDYVIQSLNKDKPFDVFTIEQLAGDLLPNPTQEQLTATAFHRNTMNNDEGGTQDEEFRVAAVLDRVNTTYEVWQSTTMACVQCHSHPYDPIRHEEFYESMAFFNNTRDEDTHDEEPKLRFYSVKDQISFGKVVNWVEQNESKEAAKKKADFLTFFEPKYESHIATDFNKAELIDTKWLGLWNGGSAYFRNIDTQGSDQMLLNYRSGLNGTRITIRIGGPEGEILTQFTLNQTKGDEIHSFPIKKIQGKNDLYISAISPIAKPQQNTSALVWFAFIPSLPGKNEAGFAEVKNSWESILKFNGTKLPILIENPEYMKRETKIFERGNWLMLGDEVDPDTPSEFNEWNPEWPRNRLGFAYWLTSKENPLTSRTLVNRIWAQLFGRGIVSSVEDMGTQSDTPSHPELLNYLAWTTMNDYEWSLKKLIKSIVTSETYKQNSSVSPELYSQDPQNKWYARGPRIRLSAEQIRDQALAVSGLLSNKMYGPGVKPPQPEGIWQTVYNGESWNESNGEDRYRRGIYTFLKRTSPYPSFISFDAGSREVCLSNRIVTNTPLQALVTLNDPVYLEAAAQLGKWMLDSDSDPQKGISNGFKKLMLTPISKEKLKALDELYLASLKEFEQNPKTLQEFMTANFEQISPELASMSVVANALLNLDEFLTKP